MYPDFTKLYTFSFTMGVIWRIQSLNKVYEKATGKPVAPGCIGRQIIFWTSGYPAITGAAHD